MSEGQVPKDLFRLFSDLRHHQGALQQPVQGTELDPQLALLRQWQSERLARTYTDLLADKQYNAICQFFLSDIYAPRDFSQRDQDAQDLYGLFRRYLPEAMLGLLADTIQLNSLTSRLDLALLQVLFEDLHIQNAISGEAYAQAYRLCDNYADRKLQIELLAKIMSEVSKGAHNPLVEAALRLAKKPAKQAGWVDLYDFLRRGYDACKPARNFKHFVSTIEQREMSILEKIYAGNPDPFDI